MTAQEAHGMTPEFALGYRQIMLTSLAGEMEITKKVFAAIPDSKSDFRPDPNARTAWELAWHTANSDVQFLTGIADMQFKMQAPAAEQKPKTVAELVAWYDSNIKSASARVAALSAEQLVTPVDFMGAFNFPAVLYLSFLNNHSIHHRGELATYLRPMGSKVPSIYGGSFDEPMQMPEPATTAA
jgi:uncharacterized damage-inducible protein DinB